MNNINGGGAAAVVVLSRPQMPTHVVAVNPVVTCAELTVLGLFQRPVYVKASYGRCYPTLRSRYERGLYREFLYLCTKIPQCSYFQESKVNGDGIPEGKCCLEDFRVIVGSP